MDGRRVSRGLALSQLEPAVHAGLGDPEILRDLGQRSLALAGDRDHVPPELQGECLRHDEHPSSEDKILTGKESTEMGAVPAGSWQPSACGSISIRSAQLLRPAYTQPCL